MYGLVTRRAENLESPGFERAFYEVKDVTGQRRDPVETAVSMLSCFGDNTVARDHPDLLARDADGTPATTERPYFDWAYVCPTADGYREQLLEMVEEVAAVNPDVRLDDVGFPREEYCHCDRCEEAFEAFDGDWWSWRAGVVTDFVAEAVDRIPGRTYFTLYPDPYPGHLHRRNGLDLDAIEPLVDEFVVTLYDTAYGTTYWLETIAKGFEGLLSTPFSIELYAANVEVDNLVHAAEVADAYATDVYFGYDASTARAAKRRLEANEQSGETYGDPS
ncbi:MAG: hypothetical protein ABEJ27_02040 [Halodesulfurarchaeum sp.]